MLGGMERRQRFLVALWAAFGLIWAFLAVEAAIDPRLEPWRGYPVMLVLYIAMVVWCGFIVVRVIRSRRAQGS